MEKSALVQQLLDARAAGRQCQAADFLSLDSLDEAMRTQADIACTLAPKILGWKVALPAAIAVAAPLHPLIVAQPGFPTLISWGERLGVEAELAVKLKKDIAPSSTGSWSRKAILDCVEGVYLGVEPIGGRLKEGNQAPFPLYLADSLDNAGYILGPRLPEGIVERVAAGQVAIKISGKAQWEGFAAHAHADPLHFLIAYANAPIDHLGGLKADQIVTTGSLCGSVPVEAPGLIRFEFDRDHRMDLMIKA